LKNFLIFLPFIFSAKFLSFNLNEYLFGFLGFICFSLTSSTIYIINDLSDLELDKLDNNKKNRPIASGKISQKNAIITIIILLILSIAINIYIKNILLSLTLLIYFILNILYTYKFKNYPIVDITLLSLFFVIRIFYGGILFDVKITNYLYLTVLSAAFYFGIGKRIKEQESNSKIRTVLDCYPKNFLNNLLNIFLTTTILYYSLWVINYQNDFLNKEILDISIFLIIIIFIYYHYNLYKNKEGNPTDILLKNKILFFLLFIYVFLIIIAFL
jgi:4-hydroxybenzoate polyprenyltransferase